MAAVAESAVATPASAKARRAPSPYPHWFYLPAAIVFGVMYLFPTISSLFFSLTRWNFQSATFIGLDNFITFFHEQNLYQGLLNTLMYGVLTSGLKVVLGLALGILLTSRIVARGYLRAVVFFPVLVSTVGIGITFTAMMHPTVGVINTTLALFHIPGPGWLTDPHLALFSVALVDVWKGVGLATVIYMAGLVSIPTDYYEAASLDGATGWQKFWSITLPLVMPATTTVIILSLIGGLRSFDLIWAMTRGGPGFTSDVIASVIYKQYQAGFYGLSTAGNVVLFVVVAAIIVPLSLLLNRRTTEA